MTGIEPAFSAWEADVRPLNDIRADGHMVAGRATRVAFEDVEAGELPDVWFHHDPPPPIGPVEPYDRSHASPRIVAAIAEMFGEGHRLPDFVPSDRPVL